MDVQFKNDLIPICELLNKHEVEYMLIGGFAVNYHGYTRATGDIDIWYKPTIDTYVKIIRALRDFGVDVSDLEQIIFDPKKCVIRLPLKRFYLDMLPTIQGDIKFSDAYRECKKEAIGTITIKVMSMEHLIKNKTSTARPSDLKDVEELNKRSKKGKP